jgi:hypothetical protein
MFSGMARVTLVAIWPRAAVLADEVVFVPAPSRLVTFDANLGIRFGQSHSPSYVWSATFGDHCRQLQDSTSSSQLVCTTLNNALNIAVVK